MAFVTAANKFHDTKVQPTDGGKTALTLKVDKKTGDVIITEITTKSDGKPGEEIEIFKNGTFNGKGVKKEADELKEIYKKTVDKIKIPNTYNSLEVKPTFVTSGANYNITGENASPGDALDIVKGIEEVVGGVLNFANDINPLTVIVKGISAGIKELGEVDDKQFKSANMEDLFPSSGPPLMYPEDLSKYQDRLAITQYTYKSPYRDAFKTPTKDLFKNGIQRNSALKKKLATLYLPMPNSVNDSNTVDWGNPSIKSLDIAAAGDLTTSMQAAGAKLGLSLAGVLGDAVGQAANVGAAAGGKNAKLAELLIKILGKGGGASADALINLARDVKLGGGVINPTIMGGIQAAILKAGGSDVPLETILQRGYGVVPNANLELLFNAPTLRSFQFSYRLSPRSENEAKIVRKIIRYFKQGMAVKKSNAVNGAGASSYLLATPNVFKLRYLYDENNQIAGVNKFKICALTAFNVDYAPDGQWSSYEKGQPVSVRISMTFRELEPVYENDYQETIFNPGKNKDKDALPFEDNYEKVKADDVGY